MVLLGSGTIEGGQTVDVVFDMRDLELYDINLNNEDVWNYFVQDTPFSKAGTLSLHFSPTSGLRIEDIVEVRQKDIEAFEYLLRNLRKYLILGKTGLQKIYEKQSLRFWNLCA